MLSAELEAILDLPPSVDQTTTGSKLDTRIWINEKYAPEILAFQHEWVDQLRSMLDQQTLKIDEMIKRNDIVVFAMQQQVERISFMLKFYLRTRLTKIEKYAQYILSEPEEIAKLSNHELEYCKK